MKALDRGVDIDILWGYDDGHGAVDWLQKLANDASQRNARGKLRFNRERSRSHAKLIIWDLDDNFEGCVGSFNWLSNRLNSERDSNDSQQVTNISVRVRHSGVMMSLCRCAAAFWSTAHSEVLSSASNRWSQIAADLEEQTVKMRENSSVAEESAETLGEPNAAIRLILGEEHEYLLSDWIKRTQARFIVLSHKLGPPAFRRLRLQNRPQAQPFQYVLVCGENELQGASLDEFKELVVQIGGQLIEAPSLHAKASVSDNRACITSFNFLYGAPFGESSIASRELGIVVEGADPASWLYERMIELTKLGSDC